MNKLITGLLTVTAVAASTFAMADELPLAQNADNSVIKSSGFYINTNTGYGKSDADISKMTNDSYSDIKKKSFAWSANIGYQFNPYVAAEIGYLDLPKVKGTSESVLFNDVKFSTDAYVLAAKAIYPINASFDVFGKAGIAYQSQKISVTSDSGYITTATNSHHHVTPLFALGAEYNVNQSWAIGLQGVTTVKGGDQYPASYTALAGLTYKFS